MGWLSDLDAAIGARLEGLQIDGQRALRSVGPLLSVVRMPLPAGLLSTARPAVFYAIERADEQADVAARVQAVLIAEDLRGAAAAWRGAGQSPGAYDLAGAVAKALVEPDLAGAAGAWLDRQRLVHADGRLVAFEQQYEVLAAGEAVRLDGQDLLGPRSIVRLVESREASRWQGQALAGSEQSWATWQGRDGAALVLAGALWASDAAGLTAIERGLDELLGDRQLRCLEVGSRPAWRDAALTAWQRTGPRAERRVLGLTGQPVRMAFSQFKQ